MRERVFKFLDRHYPITDGIINIGFDINPNAIINEIFGTLEVTFNDWGMDRFNGQYSLLHEHDGFKMWLTKDCLPTKTVNSDGFIEEFIYNDENYQTFYKNSHGFWSKHFYDERNNKIRTENSDGFWWDYTYDDRDNKIKCEDSDGFWEKWVYNDDDLEIYREDSDDGFTRTKYDDDFNVSGREDGVYIKRAEKIPNWTTDY